MKNEKYPKERWQCTKDENILKMNATAYALVRDAVLHFFVGGRFLWLTMTWKGVK